MIDQEQRPVDDVVGSSMFLKKRGQVTAIADIEDNNDSFAKVHINNSHDVNMSTIN